MADENSSSSSGDGKDPLGGTIFFIIVVFVFLSWLAGTTLFSDEKKYTDDQTREFSFSKIIGSGEIEIGKEVINRKLVGVRQSVGGSVIGEQAKRIKGKILEGPVERFGETWWRVDYEEAPDGWVTAEDITSKIGWFRTVNIVPIAYEFFRPFGIALILILLLLWLVVHFLHSRVMSIEEKKKELVKRKYQGGEVLFEERFDPSADTGNPPINLPTGENIPEFSSVKPAVKNKRWEHVKKLMDSHNESDWRQAIVEADIILETMLEGIGYDGDTIGEKLKKVEESDFLTLNKAWEAHRVRNKIAHGGLDFRLTKNEAERVIKLFEDVFQEFYYI